MPNASRLKAASTRQTVSQRGRPAGNGRGVDPTDKFILSMDKHAALSSVAAHYSTRNENFQNLMVCVYASLRIATDSVSGGLSWNRLSTHRAVPQRKGELCCRQRFSP